MATRIETSLSSDLALKRIREAHSGCALSPEQAALPRFHTEVDGSLFRARRPGKRRRLGGEVEGLVTPRDDGATIRLRQLGAEWAGIRAGASLAAAFYFAILLRSSTEAPERFLSIVLGACCADWTGRTGRSWRRSMKSRLT